jgi:hypothetical protein
MSYLDKVAAIIADHGVFAPAAEMIARKLDTEGLLKGSANEIYERTEVLEAELGMSAPTLVELGGQQFVNPLQVAWLTGNGQAVDGSDSEDPATVIHLAGGGAVYVLLPVSEVVRRLQGDE